MRKIIAATTLVFISLLLANCTSIFNPEYKASLKDARASGFLKNEDRTSTLGGIDANNDGVRDDIEGYIKRKHGHNPRYVSVYMQYARSMQERLNLDIQDPRVSLSATDKVFSQMVCTSKIDYLIEPNKMYQDTTIIRSLTENTRKRLKKMELISSKYSSSIISIPPDNHCII